MPWAKFDDGFDDSDETDLIGPEGVCMFVCSITWCSRNLTDGMIPEGRVKRLLGYTTTALALLIQYRWWVQVPGGYQVRNYLKYNPSKEQVLKERAQAAARKDEWKKRHANGLQDDMGDATGNDCDTDATNAIQNAPGNAVPSGVPSGVPNSERTHPTRIPYPVSRIPDTPKPPTVETEPVTVAEDPGAVFDAEIAEMEAESRRIEDAARQEAAVAAKAKPNPPTEGEIRDSWQSRTTPPIAPRPPRPQWVDELRAEYEAICAEFPFAADYLAEECEKYGVKGTPQQVLAYQRTIWRRESVEWRTEAEEKRAREERIARSRAWGHANGAPPGVHMSNYTPREPDSEPGTTTEEQDRDYAAYVARMQVWHAEKAAMYAKVAPIGTAIGTRH